MCKYNYFYFHQTLLYTCVYRIAGNFRGIKFSDISDIQIISENILSEFINFMLIIMALLKYFKVSKRSDNTYLPDVNGPLHG